MKKGALLLITLFAIILSLSLISAEVNDTVSSLNVEKAYTCLKNKVTSKGNCNDLSAEEQAFSLLALAYDKTSQGNCKSSLDLSSKEKTCWPSTGCKLKETALSTLALNYIGQDSSDAQSWLIAQNATPDDLVWYLQIESNEKTTCKISIDSGADNEITIDENRKINRDAGSCLTRAQDNYWLKISSSCYNKKFIVSCDKQFLTSLLYKKENSQTIFVSSKTSQASAGGSTEEKVNVKCFASGSKCDYEGSLWAALALSNSKQDISSFLPYLSASAQDNGKYLPDAFLYTLTGDEVYANNLLSQMTPSKYWQALNSPYSKYYDSALALMSLYAYNSQDIEDAKNYFLSNQGNDGCWAGVSDTSFLLYSIWPKSPANIDYANTPCVPTGFCVSSGDCDTAGGERISSLHCTAPGNIICCSKNAIVKPCIEKMGTICTSTQECAGSFVTSSDSNNCCVGECQEPQQYTCLNCKASCDSSEAELSTGTCPLNEICCGSAGKSYWWIWLLIILIILAVLAIIFRNKLRLGWFEFRGKFSKKAPPAPPQAPQGLIRRPFPAGSGPNQPSFQPRQFSPQTQRSVSKTSEFDDTLKKLREMSK